MRTVIKGATIIPMTTEDACFVGDVVIVDDKIASIGTSVATMDGDTVIDAREMIAMPSLVNAHTHLSMTYFRNFRDSVSDLHDWLSEIWKLEDKLVPEDMYVASMLGLVEMVASGTTCFADMYFFPEGTIQAVLDVGMKANIGLTLFGGIESSKERVAQLLPSLRTVRDESKGAVRFDIAPHAVYTCTEETLRYAVEVATKEGCGIHIHANETKREVSDSIATFGSTPIAHLDSMGCDGVKCYYAHCVHPGDGDIERLERNPVSVVHNPSSNCKLGSGIAPIASYLEHHIPVALGTDGASSNNSLDMFQEIRLAAMLASASTGDAGKVTPFDVLRMATCEGAAALGRADECGTLEVGKDADLILLNTKKPHLTPLNNIYSALVYSAKSSDVDTVFCKGRTLMEHREILFIDEDQLRFQFNESWNKIQQRTGGTPS